MTKLEGLLLILFVLLVALPGLLALAAWLLQEAAAGLFGREPPFVPLWLGLLGLYAVSFAVRGAWSLRVKL